MGYTKLFPALITSTVWRESSDTRVVWITMLSLTDRDGKVETSIPGLADMARVSVPACVEALERLQAPDEFSRMPRSWDNGASPGKRDFGLGPL